MLTDGMDGLLVGVAIPILTAMAFVAFLQLDHNPGACRALAIALSVCAACFAFVFVNSYPARIFLGHCGSKSLGCIIAYCAILLRWEPWLVIAGGVMLVEFYSVVLQVGSFYLFRKRVLLCSPIHHHFHLAGSTETQVVALFTSISGALSLLATALFYLGTRPR